MNIVLAIVLVLALASLGATWGMLQEFRHTRHKCQRLIATVTTEGAFAEDVSPQWLGWIYVGGAVLLNVLILFLFVWRIS